MLAFVPEAGGGLGDFRQVTGHMANLAPNQPPPTSRSAHVIVLGNEKGGSGKSTLAVHLIVALLREGHRVASIDTDSRQLSLTRYIENRSRFARRTGIALDVPTHFSVRLGEGFSPLAGSEQVISVRHWGSRCNRGLCPALGRL
jgi:hypothetical protein